MSLAPNMASTSDKAGESPSTATTTATATATATAAKTAREEQKKQKMAGASIRYPFWFGGTASSMAACVTHPLDLVKVRLQVRRPDAPSNMSGTVLHIVRTDGIRGLYAGLSASLMRQMSYSTVRFGVYEDLKQRAMRRTDNKQPRFPTLVAMASFSGFMGGVAGNAADVLNVRMQQDAALPAQERRNYRHAVDGLARMARDEGLASWFRGVLPNSLRAAAMTAGQLASYDTFKGLLLRNTPMKDNLTTHFTASFLAGVMAATVTSPVDVIKTRVMSASTKEGLAKTLSTIYQNEGLRWMFKGWVPSFLRLGPQTICTFIFLEFHRKAYRKAAGIEQSGQTL